MQNIERVTAWAFAGAHYNTELKAVEANLKAIGGRIVKQHADNPMRGLIEYGDELAALLIRHHELTNAQDFDPLNCAEGTRSEEPEGTLEYDGTTWEPEGHVFKPSPIPEGHDSECESHKTGDFADCRCFPEILR